MNATKTEAKTREATLSQVAAHLRDASKTLMQAVALFKTVEQHEKRDLYCTRFARYASRAFNSARRIDPSAESERLRDAKLRKIARIQARLKREQDALQKLAEV